MNAARPYLTSNTRAECFSRCGDHRLRNYATGDFLRGKLATVPVTSRSAYIRRSGARDPRFVLPSRHQFSLFVPESYVLGVEY